MTKLLIIVAILCLGSWLFARRRWYAPSVMMTAVWLFTLVAYLFLDRGFHPLKPEIIEALIVWITGFTVTTWIVQSIYLKPLFKDVIPSTPVRDLYYYFTLATLPIMIWAVVMIVRHTGGNPFSALRDANIRANDQGIRTTGFFVIFWMVSYIMELRVMSKTNRGRIIVLFLINLFYVVISMGKMNLMILILSTVIILSEKNIVKLKHLFVIVPILVGLMLVLQTARGSLPSKSRLGVFFTVYVGSSLSHLNANVEPKTAEQPNAESQHTQPKATKSDVSFPATPHVPVIPGIMHTRMPWTYIDNEPALNKALNIILKQPYIGLDVETTLYHQELCLIQIGCADRSFIIDPLRVDFSGLAQVFEHPAIIKIIHNATFEKTVLKKYGIQINNIVDTMRVSQKMYGRKCEGGHSLKSVCMREFGLDMDKTNQTSRWDLRPLTPHQLEYAALDAEILIHLYQHFLRKNKQI